MQLGNITAHLQKVADDILTAISDPDYAGLAMIDWEAWYPQWNSIEQRYRTYSTDHVSRQHPEWDKDTVNTVAALEWTEGAKLFMESTLQLAKLLRPKALWGYYHYPYCMVLANSTQCHPSQPKLNDEILWLFNESTIMYPSIYLIPEHVADFESSVRGRLAEAFRIREKSSDPKGAVMSYTRFNYTSTHYYFTLVRLYIYLSESITNFSIMSALLFQGGGGGGGDAVTLYLLRTATATQFVHLFIHSIL